MIKLETKILDDILELNKSALTQYTLLAELEIDNKTKTDEYQKIINNIELIATVIAKKFAKLNISDEDLLNYENALAKKYHFDDEDILAEVLYQNNHDLAAKRLSVQIFDYSLLNYCYVIEDEYIDDDYADYEEEINDCIDDDAHKEIDFELLKDRLINHTFLAYLEESIKKETNQEVKNILIRTKYNVIYLLYSMETNFLKKPNNFINPKLFFDVIGFQEQKVDLEELFIQPNEETITYHLESIAEIPNDYYNEFENNVKIYILSIYIKTLLSINISKPSDIRLKDFRKNLKLKSEKSKKYIDEAYKISKKLSIGKKVDF